MKQDVSNKVLKLQNTVVRRVVPMTEKGSDMLRAARQNVLEELKGETGEDYVAPYPVVIHMVLKHYCESKGIKIGNSNS